MLSRVAGVDGAAQARRYSRASRSASAASPRRPRPWAIAHPVWKCPRRLATGARATLGLVAMSSRSDAIAWLFRIQETRVRRAACVARSARRRKPKARVPVLGLRPDDRSGPRPRVRRRRRASSRPRTRVVSLGRDSPSSRELASPSRLASPAPVIAGFCVVGLGLGQYACLPSSAPSPAARTPGSARPTHGKKRGVVGHRSTPPRDLAHGISFAGASCSLSPGVKVPQSIDLRQLAICGISSCPSRAAPTHFRLIGIDAPTCAAQEGDLG